MDMQQQMQQTQQMRELHAQHMSSPRLEMHANGGDGVTSIMFTLVPVLIAVVFAGIIGYIIFKALSGVAEWSRNNKLPVRTAAAVLVGKRVETTHHHRNHRNRRNRRHSGFSSTSHAYMLTFETTADRKRRVFTVKRRLFDEVRESDLGDLTYQGTRFHSFVRP